MTCAQLTQGNIGRQLIALSAPLLAGNILQQLYNTVDAVIVGRFVGGAAFGAVGVAGSVMNLFLFLISGGCDGVGALLSQFYGAGDGPSFRRDFFLSGVFGTGASLALTALGLLALNPLLALLHTPESVALYAAGYLEIIFLGFPAAFAYHLSSGVLRSVGSTRAALFFLALSMGVNLGLDLLLVPRLGVEGAALATVLAQTLAAALCVNFLRLRLPELLFRREDMVLDLPLLRRTARFSFVTALHMCNLYIGKLLVQGTVNSLGEDAITAFTAATRIEGFANSFGDSGAAAAAIFIGQNTGAGEEARVRTGFRAGQRLLAGLGLFMSLAMLLGAEPCLRLVLPAGSPDAMVPALGYLRLVACFYLFNFLGSGQAGFFRGRGQVNLPVIGATGHIALRVVLSFLLAPGLGLPAVALATGLGWIGVVTFWSFFTRKDMRALER
ncbi:MATE family efflux transporter [Colidextribacter sp. OB.20]|uniref:MATE family efflux transporter n=1 Tax=Colidextribacter sp. OB.20 TaxID=2304568 RepID=UPI00136AF6BB|nr:MATE family efflux transporter [Colidextribacter sp. OB.20]NBI11190.1 MATE family efflux transporter [Colidextribacter sp. OB.20]